MLRKILIQYCNDRVNRKCISVGRGNGCAVGVGIVGGKPDSRCAQVFTVTHPALTVFSVAFCAGKSYKFKIVSGIERVGGSFADGGGSWRKVYQVDPCTLGS